MTTGAICYTYPMTCKQWLKRQTQSTSSSTRLRFSPRERTNVPPPQWTSPNVTAVICAVVTRSTERSDTQPPMMCRHFSEVLSFDRAEDFSVLRSASHDTRTAAIGSNVCRSTELSDERPLRKLKQRQGLRDQETLETVSAKCGK